MSQGGIRAGSLNVKVDYYKQTSTVDPESNQQIHGMAFDFSKMCDPRPIRGLERTQHGRENMAIITVSFRCYFDPRVTVTHSIRWEGNFYNIKGFAPMGTMNRRFMECLGELIDADKIVILNP